MWILLTNFRNKKILNNAVISLCLDYDKYEGEANFHLIKTKKSANKYGISTIKLNPLSLNLPQHTHQVGKNTHTFLFWGLAFAILARSW